MIRLYSFETTPLISVLNDIIRIITRETIAAGSAIKKFSLNLSFIAHPCPLQAAIVVSDMNDRLSPNSAPPTTIATIQGIEQPVCVEMAEAMGVRATIVPTEVPIESEVKQAAKKIPAGRNSTGTREGK